ncbi:pyridoxal-phosphate dependent enzyme [uncultured Lacinutrix sp.]|uniref:pyridoxal-phosphate dependent enzyme n=1 Tax=uncultured Lacinutrix sp. TaxID=574032 RepID=UPI002623CC8E|nr:pyridoxal-phosphate dependent enzyme [uncultured Lacinutrix sp.]
MISQKDIEITYNNIKDGINKTPLMFSPELSKISGANVYLKMESLQRTGSFKIRGVLSKLNSINQKESNKPFVAASTGNHAAAFGYASKKNGFKGILFLPERTSTVKIKSLEEYPIEKRIYGKNSMETEIKATNYANEIGGVLIHPYNDIEIIKGQGTIALEIKEQLPEVNTIMAPIGGGGLISGIASYYSNNDTITIVGCQPVNASEMYHSIKKGAIVTPSNLKTISDATAGGIQPNAITFDICKNLISNFELITEENIKKALAFIIKKHQIIIEPACALTVSPLLTSKKYRGQNVVLVITGKKINSNLLTEISHNYGHYYS